MDMLCSSMDEIKTTLKKEMNVFKAVFPEVTEILLKDVYEALPSMAERLKKVLEYNLGNPQASFSSWTTVIACKMLHKNDSNDSTESDKHTKYMAYILGWSVMLVEQAVIITDDITDGGFIRFGKTCWHRLPDIGLLAVNDSFMLERLGYRLLRTYFSEHKCYKKMRDLFDDVYEKSYWGQGVDMEVCPYGKKPAFNLLTMDFYRKMAEYRAMCFLIPIVALMHFFDRFNEDDLRTAEIIGVELAAFLTMENDYMNIYGGDYSKHNAACDIQSGKPSWFVVTALQICTDDEKIIIEENYAEKNKEARQKVLDLYNSWSLEEKFKEAADEKAVEILKLIRKLHDTKLIDLFTFMLLCIRDPISLAKILYE